MLKLARISPKNIYLNLILEAHFHWRSLKACNIAKRNLFELCLNDYIFMKLLFTSKPAWDVSERYQSDLHWERYLRDVFKTSQIHLKKDIFCVTSLIRLEHISKKDVFSVTSLRRLKNISRKYFWFFKNTSQKWFCVISVGSLQW